MSKPIRDQLGRLRPSLGIGILVILAVFVLAVCAGIAGPAALAPGQTATPTPVATLPPAGIALHPANPGDPFSLLAFLFTPIFQALFISLVVVERATGSTVVAIVVVTLPVRVVLIPLYRKQIVRPCRMQLPAPELKRDPAPVQGRPGQDPGGDPGLL